MIWILKGQFRLNSFDIEWLLFKRLILNNTYKLEKTFLKHNKLEMNTISTVITKVKNCQIQSSDLSKHFLKVEIFAKLFFNYRNF